MTPENGVIVSCEPAAAYIERRNKPRVACSYPVTLRGWNHDGGRFAARAVLSNLSATGMFLYTKHPLSLGEAVFILVRMSTRPQPNESAPQLAARGKVVRIETRVDNTYSVAIQIQRHRFI